MHSELESANAEVQAKEAAVAQAEQERDAIAEQLGSDVNDKQKLLAEKEEALNNAKAELQEAQEAEEAAQQAKDTAESTLADKTQEYDAAQTEYQQKDQALTDAVSDQ